MNLDLAAAPGYVASTANELSLTRSDLVEALDAMEEKRRRLEGGVKKRRLSRTASADAEIRRLRGVEGRLKEAIEKLT